MTCVCVSYVSTKKSEISFDKGEQILVLDESVTDSTSASVSVSVSESVSESVSMSETASASAEYIFGQRVLNGRCGMFPLRCIPKSDIVRLKSTHSAVKLQVKKKATVRASAR